MNSYMHPNESDSYFTALTNPQFYSQGQIWHKKQQPIPCKNFKEKFQFYKVGKTFKLFTQRILTLFKGRLFYFDNQRSELTKGCCQITNLYCGFFTTNQRYPYRIRLTNYDSFSDIYLQNKDHFNSLKRHLMKYCVQINFDQQFKLVEKLGEGSFAKVYLGKKKQTGAMYAIKVVRKLDLNSIESIDVVKQEKSALILCSSPYCSQFYQFYQDMHHYYFVLEYIQGKSLMNIIKQQIPLTIENKITIIKGVLEALDHIHTQKIANRDVKPQNIIVNLNSFEPKIIDLGLTISLQEETPLDDFKRCGTMGYIAPEVMRNVEGKRVKYTEKVDIFSFGIVCHILLLGVNPLKGKTYQETFQKNKEFDIKLNKKAINQQYGQYCGQFLQGLLQYDPKKRLSAKTALNHPFLKGSYHSQKTSVIVTFRESVDFQEEHVKYRLQSPTKKHLKKKLNQK